MRPDSLVNLRRGAGRFVSRIGHLPSGPTFADFTDARVGLEARGCGLDGLICLVDGLDAGYRRERLVAEFDGVHADLATATVRLGLDLGGKHVRMHASVQSGVDQGGWNGLGLTTGVAYTW